MVMYYKNFAISGAIEIFSFSDQIIGVNCHIIMDMFTKDTFYLTATSLIGFIALIGINSRNSTLIILKTANDWREIAKKWSNSK